ncbi:MAG TPA: ATP-binding protein [Streptosporangiaceae bacterium]|nr:ATP-binding protein [Streptosporangiaceae bacterium]
MEVSTGIAPRGHVGSKDLVATAAYQPEPTAAAAARRFVRDTLQSWVVAGAAADGHGLVDDAVLLTSELVTNAVVHAGTSVRVTCKLSASAVEVVVSDSHPARLVPEMAVSRRAPAEHTSGRGLLLPAALASSWGVTYGRSAKAVWFRLGLQGSVLDAGAAEGADEGPAVADSMTDQDVSLTSLLSADALGPVLAPALVFDQQPAPDLERLSDADQAPSGDPGYQRLLAKAVASAKAELGADAAVALVLDEEGDLRLRAVAGSMPSLPGDQPGGPGGAGVSEDLLVSLPASGPAAPSVVTVPFIVDGRVTGLLAAVSAGSSRFTEADNHRLQALADECGPVLYRAWLTEMERVRRGRMAALAEASGLLGHGLDEADILALAGRVTVPRLAPWCAVLLGDDAGGLRPALVRHAQAGRRDALAWLLGRLCETGAWGVPLPEAASGQGWRRPLSLAGQNGVPAGVDAFAAEVAWCFPLSSPKEGGGMLVVGSASSPRLPREVAALAADLACRIGIALDAARLVGQGS